MRSLLPLFLAACAPDPYPDYWEAGAGPSLAGIDPPSVTSLAAGQPARILGSGLAEASTVVVGTRNATLVEVADDHVDVLLPEGAPGGGPVDLAVVTPDGMASLEGAFTWDIRGWEFWAAESASVTLYKIDCPVEVWTQANPKADWDYTYWCGVEQGYASAYAFDGTGRQPGFSGDQADVVELSTLPEPGGVRVWGPGDRRPTAVPYLYGVHAEDETLSITTPRDFARDLAEITRREDWLRDYYYWYAEYPEAFTWHGPVAGVYGPDACWEQDLSIADASGDWLDLGGEAGDLSGALLGFWVTEDYGGGDIYESVGYTGSVTGISEGGGLRGDPSGAELVYDGYSGWFFPAGVAGTLGPSDLPEDAPWDVWLTRLGEDHPLGGFAPLRDLASVRLHEEGSGLGEALDLLTGDVAVLRGGDLTVTWEAGDGGDGDTSLDFVMVEIRVYDASLEDPYWLTEVARLVAHGDDASGQVVIPAEELQKLPVAVCSFTRDGDLTGLWAELSVARHQLRKLSLEEAGVGEGDLVADFIHVVNAPVMVRDR
ncbi:MAG: IPT/TIG domain-containing protein [Pseudomonadota bacterium]